MSTACTPGRRLLAVAVAGILTLIQVHRVNAQVVPSSPAVSPAADGTIQPVPMTPSPNQPVTIDLARAP